MIYPLQVLREVQHGDLGAGAVVIEDSEVTATWPAFSPSSDAALLR